MSLWRHLSRGLRTLTRRNAADRDLADEVEHFLEEDAAARIARGCPPEEARRLARAELGGASGIREEVRSYGWENRLDNLWADLRYAVRTLTANPGFATVSVLTLALGIGASTAIFSLVEAVLLRALPYPEPQQIVRVWEQAANGHRMNVAGGNFEDFRRQNTSFSEFAVYNERLGSVAGGTEPVRLNWSEVSAGFFPAFGVQPLRGRWFTSEEWHGAHAAVVSAHFWRRYLEGGNLSGRQIRIDGVPYLVVGVMPESFDIPAGTSVWTAHDLGAELESRSGHNWRGIGRLRPGVTAAQARADLGAIAGRIHAQFGRKADLRDAAVTPLAQALVGDVQTALFTLLGAVGLLLLVACANVAGLLVARGAARRRELALRVALGAGGGRLLQQFLVESSVLAASGGSVGVLLAAWAVRLLPAVLPSNLPRQQGIAMNPAALLFAVGAVAMVSVLLGLLAAWRAGRGDLQQTLAAGSRSHTGSQSTQRLRGAVVTGQIAATLVILVAAGLLGRSFQQLLATDPGFDTAHLITMSFSVPMPENQLVAPDEAAVARQVRLLDDLAARIRTLPGVRSAGVASGLPVANGDNLPDGDFLILNGTNPPAGFEDFARIAQNPAQVGHALYGVAGAEYFKTLGIPLIRGRMFTAGDTWAAPHVAVISESLARTRWPEQDPIGRVIEYGNMDGNLKPLTVVGVVGDVRARGLASAPAPVVYVSYRQRGLGASATPVLLIRTDAAAPGVAASARALFYDLAPGVPVQVSTFDREMDGWLADRRFLLLLVGLFAGAALLLAAIGLYGVVAFSVVRRTQEIGIRMALGARRADVLRLVVGEGARLVAAGSAVGLAVSLLATRLLASLLFGVTATDPLTFAAVAALLAGVALLAAYLPARRATRLDPNRALRYE